MKNFNNMLKQAQALQQKMMEVQREMEDKSVEVTSGGGIRVDLAEDYNLTVDAKTSGGRVRTEFPVTVSGDISKTSLRADVNDGGPELYVRTSGGNITLGRL